MPWSSPRQKPAIHATTVPVAYCDAGMQRKATAPAISSGCPALERGAVGDTLIVRAVGAARRIDRGLDIARCHRVDPDSCLGPGQCHALVRVADPNVARLNIAQSSGAKAHPVGDASQRFALIVECSGAHAARNLGIEVVLPRGALVLVGENAESWTIEEGKVFRRKDFYMIRTFYFPIANFAPNIELLCRYRQEYRVLVDGEFGLSAAAPTTPPTTWSRRASCHSS